MGKVSVGHTVTQEYKTYLSVLWFRSGARASALGVFRGLHKSMDSIHTLRGEAGLTDILTLTFYDCVKH